MDLLFLFCFLCTQIAVAVLGLVGNTVGAGNTNTGSSGDSNSLLRLAPSTSSITHFVNDSFIIFCKPSAGVPKDISTAWRAPNGKEWKEGKGRVHIEKKAGSLALVFEHITVADRGNWTCEATNVAGVGAQDTRISFELLVNQKISFANTDFVQSTPEGRDATVKCLAKGDPEPDISWLYNGEYINISNTTKYRIIANGLFIRNVSQYDAGEYTCRAMRITPTFSDTDQITILLRIQHKPRWYDNDTTPQYAYIGGQVNLTCNALGEPPPAFTWLHAGRALTGPDYRIFYTDYGSVLGIHVRNETQLGDYKCKVSNAHGMLERIVRLQRGQQPFTPTRFQLKRLLDDGFELDIRSVKYSNVADNMQVLGYRVEYMSEPEFKFSAGNWSYAKRRDFNFDRGRRFILRSLATNTTYLMRCASRNLAGLSDWTAVKIFATLSNFANASVRALAWHTCLVVAFVGWWAMAPN